ncbi:MAG: 3-oxoacyl-[acyl-carrier-protein] reductase [Verrucomicrobiota bacterium]|nr:3-oxoacyl-[acyl-carrier-protein] reductase [Verrucomicrobiota bacterium]
MSLENLTAVVTGAGRGIGRAIALRLAQDGANIVCVSRTESNSQKVADEVTALDRKSWAVAVDVGDTEAVEVAVAKILEDTEGVNILVNNAGVTRDGLLMRMSEEDWDTVLDTNLKGAFTLTKALARSMRKAENARIINISSVVGLMGNAGQANYAASKAGLIGFTKSCAKEFAKSGITVNAIAPGFIATDMTDELSDKVKVAIKANIPMGELGKVGDIAEAAAYLAGPGARYVTGQVLTVDGGMVM